MSEFTPLPPKTSPTPSTTTAQLGASSSKASSSLMGIDTSASNDPLVHRPHISSIVLCIVFGIVALLTAAALWWFSVHTSTGQYVDDVVLQTMSQTFPHFLLPLMAFFTYPYVAMGIVWAMGILAIGIAFIRRRWRLLVQISIFIILSAGLGFALKRVLPRPFYDVAASNNINTSPSGHSVAAFTAAIILVIAVPLFLRAVTTIIAFAFASCVGLSVVISQWHRPSDVIVAFLLVLGIALLVLAMTKESGMDKPGERRSSPSIQITATIMIISGIVVLCFGGFLMWQVAPSLSIQSDGTVIGENAASVCGIIGMADLGMGLVLALRQLTASPLSPIGVVGAPPAPPVVSGASTPSVSRKTT